MLTKAQRDILALIEDEYTDGNSLSSEEQDLAVWLLETGMCHGWNCPTTGQRALEAAKYVEKIRHVT